MATAPTPGAYDRNADGVAKPKPTVFYWKLTMLGETLELPAVIPLGEKRLVRQSLGLPLEAYMPRPDARTTGEDTFAVLWWLARRHAGEDRLSYAQVEATWPSLTSSDDYDIEIVADDPEVVTDDPGKSDAA